MKKLFISIFLFCALLVRAQYQLEWVSVPQVPNGREIFLDDALVDGEGNSYVRCYEEKYGPTWGIEMRKYVVSLDKNGIKKWEVDLGNDFMPEMNYIKVLAVRDEYVYTPTLERDTLKVHKIDTAGRHWVVYTQYVPASSGIVYDLSLMIASNNHLYVDFQVRNQAYTSGIVELDMNDQVVNVIATFGSRGQIQNPINIDNNENITTWYTRHDSTILTSHVIKYLPNGTLAWDTIVATGTHHFYLFDGDTAGNFFIAKDGAINKFSNEHIPMWSHTFPNYYILASKVARDGDVFLMLDRINAQDQRIVRIDKDGIIKFDNPIGMLASYRGFFVNNQKQVTLVTLLQKDYPYMPNRPMPYEIVKILRMDESGVVIENMSDTLFYPVYNQLGDEPRIVIDENDNFYFNYNFQNPQSFARHDSIQSIKRWMWYAAKYCKNCKNSIRGTVAIDTNANCVIETGERGARGTMLQLGSTNRYSFTNINGKYNFSGVDSGHHLVKLLPPEYLLLHCDSESIVFVSDTGVLSEADFVLEANPQCITYLSTAATRARFGFNQSIIIEYGNSGFSDLSGSVSLTLANGFQFISSVPNYDHVNGDTYYWNFSNLHLMDDRRISVEARVLTPLSNPFSHYTQLITPCIQSTDTLSDIVVGSYDPNDKIIYPLTVREHNEFLSLSEPLTYQINFQNTGSDTAFRVVLRDTISNSLDLTTFTMLSASHPYEINILGERGIEWIFKNILLPDSSTNEPMSHGFVKYSIKPNSSIPLNTSIFNSAAIYFDFNDPVFTNTLETRYVKTYSSLSELSEVQFSVVPNPAMDYLHLNNIKSLPADVSITDLTGKRVKSYHISTSKEATLNISDLQKGVYLLIVATQSNSSPSIFKIVKM